MTPPLRLAGKFYVPADMEKILPPAANGKKPKGYYSLNIELVGPLWEIPPLARECILQLRRKAANGPHPPYLCRLLIGAIAPLSDYDLANHLKLTADAWLDVRDLLLPPHETDAGQIVGAGLLTFIEVANDVPIELPPPRRARPPDRNQILLSFFANPNATSEGASELPPQPQPAQRSSAQRALEVKAAAADAGSERSEPEAQARDVGSAMRTESDSNPRAEPRSRSPAPAAQTPPPQPVTATAKPAGSSPPAVSDRAAGIRGSQTSGLPPPGISARVPESVSARADWRAEAVAQLKAAGARHAAAEKAADAADSPETVRAWLDAGAILNRKGGVANPGAYAAASIVRNESLPPEYVRDKAHRESKKSRTLQRSAYWQALEADYAAIDPAELAAIEAEVEAAGRRFPDENARRVEIVNRWRQRCTRAQLRRIEAQRRQDAK